MTDLFHEYGLPTPDEAIENGCVSRLQRAWLHPAVFIARDACKRKLGWEFFGRGAPSERGGKPLDSQAFKRVRECFLAEYLRLCALVREGEVLTCSVNISGFVPKPREVRPMEKTGFNKPVSREEASRQLAAIKARLSGG